MLMKKATSWFKKIDVRIESWYERFNSWFIGSIIIKTICAIVVALLIAYLTSAFSAIGQKKHEIKAQQDFVSSVGIGYNKQHIDNALGAPAQYIIDELTGLNECCYQIEDALFRAYYENDTLRGFFITLKSKDAIGKYQFEQYKKEYHLSRTIGEYSFDELYYEFNRYIGHCGVDILMCPCYIEAHYISSHGVSINAVFAIHPDGLFIEPVTAENKVEHYDGRYRQWGGDFPNTWGIVDDDYMVEICSLLLDNVSNFQNGFYLQYQEERQEFWDLHGGPVGYNYNYEYDDPLDPNWFGQEMDAYFASIAESMEEY